MTSTALRALRAVVVLALLTGLAYPLVMTGIAQLTMSRKADGSLIQVDGKVVGSSSIGQLWQGKEWFHGRPSAINYDASTSSGSNLGPNSQELSDQIAENIMGYRNSVGAKYAQIRPPGVHVPS